MTRTLLNPKNLDEIASGARTGRYDLWTHGGQGVGWRLQEKGLRTLEARAGVSVWLHQPGVVAVCILPAGVSPSKSLMVV